MCFAPDVYEPYCHSLETISILGAELVKMLGDKELPSVA